MKAKIKKTGELVNVISRFMPKKRNVPSRDWICNLSNGTCINESELEYISDNIEGNQISDIGNAAREYAENHYSEWEETWYDYNGYNAEPENDKLELIDAFIAGAKRQAEHAPLPEDTVIFNKGVAEGKRLMLEGAVEYEVMDFSSSLETHPFVSIHLDNKKYRFGDTVRVIVLPKED